MKSLLLYIWSVFIMGTFTAIVTGMGNAPFLAYVLCYCFWGGMLMPMLGTEERTYTGNEKRRKETTGSN